MKSAREMFDKITLNQKIKKIQENSKKSKILRKQEYLIDLKNDLLCIQEKMNKSLEEGYLLFNITTRDNLELAYKIFKKGEQYTFGDELWHYHHIYINKMGIKKLEKMLFKTNKKLQTINKQIEELNWK